MSNYFKNLCAIVCENSTTNNFREAAKEWDVLDTVDAAVEEPSFHKCICGKEDIRYLTTIQNRITGSTLYPIGSECIKRFENETLKNDVKDKIKIYNMKNKKMSAGKYKGLTYEQICDKHLSYVHFILGTSTNKKAYDNLIMYYLYGRRRYPRV